MQVSCGQTEVDHLMNMAKAKLEEFVENNPQRRRNSNFASSQKPHAGRASNSKPSMPV